MDINIKVRLESPELIDAILALVQTLPKINLGASSLSVIEEKLEVIKEDHNVDQVAREEVVKEKNESEKAITLEEVRKVLATKSKNGKQAEVKELIKKYGVDRLTEIDSCNYKELLELAEVL